MTTLPKLTYFDFAGSRGEECRLALVLSGVEFEDERLSREQWAALKPASPFGKLPLLTIPGKGTLAQTNAILGYIGRTWGLCPREPWEAAQHDALLIAAEELRELVQPVLHISDPDERRGAREALAKGPMQEWAARVERAVKGPYAMGEALSTADIKLFMVYEWFARGIVDHVPPDVFAAYPRLSAIHRAVGSDERVRRFRAGH